MAHLTITGRDVPISVTGSGPAVLLVPGGAARTQGYWLDVPEVLAESATVVSVDRPGVGTSPWTGPRLSLADQGTHLAAVIRAADAGPAVLVSHSLGGPVALQTALDHADVVAGLVLLDPTPIDMRVAIETLSATLRVLALVEGSERLRPGLRAKIAKRYWDQLEGWERTAGLEEAGETMIDPQHWRLLAKLSRGLGKDTAELARRLQSEPLAVPGVLVTAERPPKDKIGRGHVAMARLARLDLDVWEGTTHIVHVQRPQRVVATVRGVLERTA